MKPICEDIRQKVINNYESYDILSITKTSPILFYDCSFEWLKVFV